jgi:putative oxidoreductase
MSSIVSTHPHPALKSEALTLAPQAHWLLRLAFAGVFLFHGISKFIAPAAFAEMMQLPLFITYAVAFAEVAGGLGLLAGAALRLGWLTRLAAAATLPVLIGAIAMVHWGQWSFVASDTHPMGGIEFQVVLLAIAGYFLVRGNE